MCGQGQASVATVLLLGKTVEPVAMARPAHLIQEDCHLAAILVAHVVVSTDMIGRNQRGTLTSSTGADYSRIPATGSCGAPERGGSAERGYPTPATQLCPATPSIRWAQRAYAYAYAYRPASRRCHSEGQRRVEGVYRCGQQGKDCPLGDGDPGQCARQLGDRQYFARR